MRTIPCRNESVADGSSGRWYVLAKAETDTPVRPVSKIATTARQTKSIGRTLLLCRSNASRMRSNCTGARNLGGASRDQAGCRDPKNCSMPDRCFSISGGMHAHQNERPSAFAPVYPKGYYARCMRIRQTKVFEKWLRKLRDRKARARIGIRIRRLSLGSLGDVRPVGKGVSELRIDSGPGYRVYVMVSGSHSAVLLIGGDKRT